MHVPAHSTPTLPRPLLRELPGYNCLQRAAALHPDLNPLATESFFHLLRTGDLLFAQETRLLAQHGLSSSRFMVLMLLLNASNHADTDSTPSTPSTPATASTPAELADKAGVTRATMTGLLDTLAKDGMIERTPAPDDRRTTLVRLTEAGRTVLTEAAPGYFRHVASLLQSLSARELSQLLGLLQKLQLGISSSHPEPAAQTVPA